VALELSRLRAHLRDASLRCVRAPVDRFAHPWLAPMAPSAEGERWLAARAAAQRPDSAGDRFSLGDYGLGLFHHDVSESAIALARDPAIAEACYGSLLCFLDCAAADGCIHRIELPHATRDYEPAKPVMAQLALRALDALGGEGIARAAADRVLPRLLAFVAYLESTHVGAHGLFLTPSARASGFDNDLSTAGMPERSVEGPDTNALMVLEYRALAELARRLGDDPGPLDAKAAALAAKIEKLLYYEDEQGGFYAALRSRPGRDLVAHADPDGVSRPVATWTGLMPLYAGVPAPPRARAIADRVLDPRGYWGPAGLRTVPRSSPFFQQAPRAMLYDPRRGERGPVSNWAGPVWVLSSYYIARGLERFGFVDAARELDAKTLQVLARDLEATGSLHECYDDEGRGLWPAQGGFVSWNVLALALMDGIADPVLALR
jgi:putative isomerase